MKITKSQLAQIITEELEIVKEELEQKGRHEAMEGDYLLISLGEYQDDTSVEIFSGAEKPALAGYSPYRTTMVARIIEIPVSEDY
jgi:hypothetical protein